jgi:hypothetical protein
MMEAARVRAGLTPGQWLALIAAIMEAIIKIFPVPPAQE